MTQKPVTMLRREFVENMSKMIAESGLPFSMLADILKDATLQLQQLELEQYEKDKKQYEEELKKESEDS